MSPTVLKREERRRPVTRSLHQSLEAGLPMVTRAKTQSIQIAEDEEPQECIVVNNYEVNVEIEETSVVVAKVEPQQGIFKSHVVPAVEFVAPVIVATVVGEALFRLAVYYSY